MAGPRNGMRLGRRMATFIVVDAVLVTLFLVVLALTLTGSLAGLGGSGSSLGAPSTQASTPVGLAPAVSPSGSTTTMSLASFALPSGNIACTMSNDGARCTIASITFTTPAGAACTGTTGHVFTLGPDGVTIPCVDGPAPGPAPAGTPRLEYGSVSAVGGYTCTSSTNGVRCVQDASGRGFDLARGQYTKLP
jgi:hypothetical protein